MGHLILWRYPGSKSQSRKSLVTVIILADLAHGHQRPQVLVGLVRVDVVEGAAVPWVTIGGCEVDGYRAVDLAATHDVIQEGVDPVELQVRQDHHPRVLVIALLLFVLGIHTVPLGLGQGQGQAETPPRAAGFRPLPHKGQEPLNLPV